MIELRLRNRITDAELESKVGKVLTPADVNVLLVGATRVLRPNGSLLCVYLPGALASEMDDAYPTLTKVRVGTNVRGLASGTESRQKPGDTRKRNGVVTSAILGAYEYDTRAGAGGKDTCRLTSFTAQHVAEWQQLQPLLQSMARLMAEHVPDRAAAQQAQADRTKLDWVVPKTPYTTITVNNTYPTGVHTDKGDLDEGVSCLATARRGSYAGGWLTFPRYRVAANMGEGDLMLMDAHEWHGNTAISCNVCGENLSRPGHQHATEFSDYVSPERVSVVAYYRTEMVKCGSLDQENAKRAAARERDAARKLGLA